MKLKFSWEKRDFLTTGPTEKLLSNETGGGIARKRRNWAALVTSLLFHESSQHLGCKGGITVACSWMRKQNQSGLMAYPRPERASELEFVITSSPKPHIVLIQWVYASEYFLLPQTYTSAGIQNIVMHSLLPWWVRSPGSQLKSSASFGWENSGDL